MRENRPSGSEGGARAYLAPTLSMAEAVGLSYALDLDQALFNG